jgi:hypothetical protein
MPGEADAWHSHKAQGQRLLGSHSFDLPALPQLRLLEVRMQMQLPLQPTGHPVQEQVVLP